MHALRVVLVRTEIAGNIGSVARVMGNMGAADLVLVAPVADPSSEQAETMATHHARDLLRSARVVPDLASALADCVSSVATSAITGGQFRRQNVGTPEQIAPAVVSAMASGVVALVLGPEPTGLDNDEVSRCHYQMHIPTAPAHAALNLSHAAAVCLYEVRRTWLAASGQSAERQEVAPIADQALMFAHLERGLDAIGYLRGHRGPALMHALRHLIGRAGPSPMEVNLLLGLARQLEWIAGRGEENKEIS
jgi:tRNA/rRNA methyltransferase